MSEVKKRKKERKRENKEWNIQDIKSGKRFENRGGGEQF